MLHNYIYGKDQAEMPRDLKVGYRGMQFLFEKTFFCVSATTKNQFPTRNKGEPPHKPMKKVEIRPMKQPNKNVNP
ncbi:hypothetical protein IX306_000026 [Porphyromonas levii]|nr:hypothetical protein [Porphyromonas levii]MBR8772926.1 hypothetical protein [Porphyromonas levii]